jgi:extracellular elastinolytic metalloproteinase
MISRKALARAVAAASVTCLVVASGAMSGSGSDATNAALTYVKDHRQEFGLTGSDIKDVAVSDAVFSAHNGVTHVYLQQQYKGIDVYTGLLNVNVARDGSVISAGNRFVSNLAAAAGGQSAKKAAVEAAAAAADHLGLKPSKALKVLDRKGGAAEKTSISDGGIAEGAIEAELVWLPTDGAVRLAWSVRLDEADHWWNAFVDAETGASLGQNDLIIHEDAKAIAQGVAPSSSTASELPTFPATDNASYRVFPIPFESPSDGDRVLVQNPADPSASPFGWHDTNGIAGPEFTVTRGNNVHAYADRDNNNVPDPGSDPNGGAGLVFDFPLDLASRPLDSQPAFVTNLFYWNNVIHDVMHNYGFDEVSGNFQATNYTGQGLGADYVRAEAQDGSGRNNANFGTDVDGVRPRMQMFEWRSATPNPIFVNSGPLAGQTFFGPMAGFGESLVTTGPITGDVVYIGRGCDPAYSPPSPPNPVIPLDPYLADPAGKIALIDRGVCTFTAKVKKAEDRGALMVIVANNIAGPATAMGGADPSITIPSVMVTDVDGNTFKANPGNNVTVSDGTGGVPDRDSDLDNGVIAHEYGHGISNRLTGGPNVVGCLNSNVHLEHMGEGWSDYYALVLTTSPSDTATTARGVGSYVSFQPADGPGIRPTPYSTDTSVNPSTYDSIKDTVNISQPHGVGYVWNTMLWEVYWNLVAKYGYNANVYADWYTGGNNLAIQLVTDGLKFQPCGPGFVDGRDAILAADEALTGGANYCEIWRGFAKRGLGTGAVQGASTSRTDNSQDFTVPATCSATAGAFRPPIKAAPTLNERDAGDIVPVKYSITGLSPGQAVTLTSESVGCDDLRSTAAPTPIQTTGDPTKKGNEYHVNWVTDPAWAGTCRRLTLQIDGASSSVAYFRFG